MILTALTVGVASPAFAITNGSADGTGHPEVGALIAGKPHSDGTYAYCTGTLIAPTVFLTAAHCGEHGQTTARVTFSSHYQVGDKVYTGRYVKDPRYKSNDDLHDMAVVVFKSAVTDIQPAILPTLGVLDHLKGKNSLKAAIFTPVGYGSLNPTKGPHGKRRYAYNDTRNQTSISFKTLSRMWLDLRLDHSRNDGSTCFGDSGGPNFLGGAGSHLLVATTISGADNDCRAANFDYRVDTASARHFLSEYVKLP
jgi:hypothetical protein